MTNKLPGVAVYPHATNATTIPADDTAVTNALRALMALDAAQLATLAAKLAATFSDRLADMLLSAVGMEAPPVMPSERFLWAVVTHLEGDVDYDYLPAMAQ